MANIQGQSGELSMTVQVVRKATGKVETYEVRGGATREQVDEIKKAGLPVIEEDKRGRNP